MLKKLKIVEIESVGIHPTHDIWNFDERCQDSDGGNFFVNGVLTHNSIPEAIQNRDDTTGSWKNKLRDIHPIFLEVLEDTYGVICYQEQLQALWQRIAGFTAPEAQEARKAVAKKWQHKLVHIEQKWLEGATKNIGETAAKEWWDKMVTFGRYAFNRCLSSDTKLRDKDTGQIKSVEEWKRELDKGHKLYLESYDGQIFVDECIAIHENGEQEVFEVDFDNGQKEYVTLGHKFLCEDGEFHTVLEIIHHGYEIKEIHRKCD